jgi:hypothetical protein
MIDPITLEPIYKNSIHAVSIHKQLYCANSLIDSIIYSYKENIISTIPHNREPYTEEILQNIYNKSDDEHKSEIIIKLIKIIKFPIKIQKQIVCLTNKQQKIIFNCLDQEIISDKQIITIIEFFDIFTIQDIQICYLLSDMIAKLTIVLIVNDYEEQLYYIKSKIKYKFLYL